MTVCEMINLFTHTNFTLIVLDAGTDYEYFNGLAEDVCDDPVSDLLVVAIEPPMRENEVIVYIDMDSYLDSDAEIIPDDVLDEL